MKGFLNQNHLPYKYNIIKFYMASDFDLTSVDSKFNSEL